MKIRILTLVAAFASGASFTRAAELLWKHKEEDATGFSVIALLTLLVAVVALTYDAEE
jgi:hypothetical protein